MIDQYYKEYLTDKLKLLFNNSGNKEIDNPFYKTQKNECNKSNDFYIEGDKVKFIDGRNILDGYSFKELHEEELKSSNYKYYKGTGTDNKVYIFDMDGNLLFDKAYDDISLIDNEYAVVKEKLKKETINDDGTIGDKVNYRIINKDGKTIHDNGNTPYTKIEKYNNCIVLDDKGLIVIMDKDLQRANVQKGLFGYNYNNNGEIVRTRFRPIKLYNNHYAICISRNKELYLFDAINKSYGSLGNIKNAIFNDNFIKIKDKIYFPYQKTLLDITDYYNEHLKELKTIIMNSNVGTILSKLEYIKQNGYEFDSLEDTAKSDKMQDTKSN